MPAGRFHAAGCAIAGRTENPCHETAAQMQGPDDMTETQVTLIERPILSPSTTALSLLARDPRGTPQPRIDGRFDTAGRRRTPRHQGWHGVVPDFGVVASSEADPLSPVEGDLAAHHGGCSRRLPASCSAPGYH